MIRSSVQSRALLALASTLFTVALAEAGLRIWLPNLPFTSVAASSNDESPYRWDPVIGYEMKPFAVQGDEVLNSDGFRGPERTIPKPPGVYRILAIGDSVVEAAIGDITYEQTWEKVLEDALTRASGRTGSDSDAKTYEVINAGVGGYTSWQTLMRLHARGLKQQPDMVIALVGWADMDHGFFRDWRPGTFMEPIRELVAMTERQSATWRWIKRRIVQWTSIGRLIHRMRQHRRLDVLPPGSWSPERRVAFNTAALDHYLSNLEKMRDALEPSGSRLAVIAYPGLVTTNMPSDLQLLPTTPTFQDYLDAHERYLGAIRSFADRHPDVVLVEADRAFSARPVDEQVELFVDEVHLSPAGNRLLAEIIGESLRRRGIAP